MEYYRYQLESQADFKMFTAWLIDNKITFTSQHNYIPAAGDQIYHVTVYAPQDSESEIFAAVGTFLSDNIAVKKMAHMPSQVTSPEDAVNDMYADAETLRVAAKSLFATIKEQSDEHAAAVEKLNREVTKVKECKDFYRDQYHDELSRTDRIKKQVQSIAVLMDSIFPKDKN